MQRGGLIRESAFLVFVHRILLVGVIVGGCVTAACGGSSSKTAPATPTPTAPTGTFADLSGAWTGTIESTNFPVRTISVNVAQTTNCVDGAWTSSTGDWRGAISGFASADAFQGFISFERSASGGGLCNATGMLSGGANGNSAQLTSSSLTPVGSCSGDLPAGIVVTLHR